MRGRTPVTLFPFLSVLISTMGVLAFLAVTFLLFARQEATPQPPPKPVEVNWVGAPEHVRPLLVECRADGLVYHPRGGGSPRFFSRQSLEEEAEIVKAMQREGVERLGAAYDRQQLWLILKQGIDRNPRLRNSFTGIMHQVELRNLSREGRRSMEQHFPILLVFPDGVEIYGLASYLVETTTRLSVGLEPMLPGWQLPYRKIGAS